MSLPSLSSLSLGFRNVYVDFDTLTAQLHAWASAYPSIVSLESIGRSAEGRDLWLLTIGADPGRTRPAVWVDANMHANEFVGTSVALAIAETILAVHLEHEAPRALGTFESAALSLPMHVKRVVREGLFYVVPRVSPDGAEAVLRDGRYVRSVPRDARLARGAPRWVAHDLDGDGNALLLRKEDPTGEFVEHPSAPGVMVSRTLEDEGPFFKLWPEGLIEGFDGDTIPSPSFLSDNYPDLNRNFPFQWAAEPDQKGSGEYPGSEPESRAVLDAAARRPNVFVWLDLHSFGGCFIRPPGDVPDANLDAFDRAVYRQVGVWAESTTGYPMVSGHDEFLYEPGRPLHGALAEWAYSLRGALAYVCELWDLFARLDIPRPKRFVDYYTSLTRDDVLRLAQWDAAKNAGRIFVPWRRVQHPQLGEVEVGGFDRRVGLFNPPYDELPAVCEAQAQLMTRVAALLPRLVISRVEVAPLRENVTRVTVTIENHGYLPTYGMRGAVHRPFNEPLFAELRCDGCALEEPLRSRLAVGHLEGWGRGLGASEQAVFFQSSSGSTSSRAIRFTALGKGWVTVRVGSSRAGFVERRIGIGGGV